jgi:sec-independent protein translocase protein TatA
MPEIGITGLIVILIVALLVFGPKRLPELGRSLGSGIRSFRDGLSSGAEAPADEEPDSAERAGAPQPGDLA